MKKLQPRKATRYIWAKLWWILGYVLCIVGITSGCGHPIQCSTEKTGTVLGASLTRGPARGPLYMYAANS